MKKLAAWERRRAETFKPAPQNLSNLVRRDAPKQKAGLESLGLDQGVKDNVAALFAEVNGFPLFVPVMPPNPALARWNTFYLSTSEEAEDAARFCAQRDARQKTESDSSVRMLWDNFRDITTNALRRAMESASKEKEYEALAKIVSTAIALQVRKKAKAAGIVEKNFIVSLIIEDVTLKARYLLVEDHLKPEDRESCKKYIDSRLEGWQKGHTVLCEINGVLYAFAKIEYTNPEY